MAHGSKMRLARDQDLLLTLSHANDIQISRIMFCQTTKFTNSVDRKKIGTKISLSKDERPKCIKCAKKQRCRMCHLKIMFD